MSFETKKKRKQEGREEDGLSAAGRGDGVTAANPTITEMKKTLSCVILQMTKMREEMDGMKERLVRVDELEARCKTQEENFRLLEARCNSLERTVGVLTKDQEWKYLVSPIPSSHWEGHNEDYILELESFFNFEMKRYTNMLRGGKCHDINFERDYHDELLPYDGIFLPHWKEFADALQISNYSGNFFIAGIELSLVVLDMLTLALATKQIVAFRSVNPLVPSAT